MEIENHKYVVRQLKQQERIVSQLVAILAHTNHKVKTLQQQVQDLESIQKIKRM